MRLAWVVLAATATALGIVSYGYVSDPANYEDPFRVKYLAHLGLVLLHGILGITALLTGPLLFMPGLRQRWPRAHRVLGMLYYAAVFPSSISGLRMALMAEGGTFARIGFSLLAIGWLLTATLSIQALRKKRYRTHGRWMARNYALTFSAVTLRLGLAYLQQMGFTWDTLYPVMSYASWIPNLLVAEAVLASLQPRPRRVYT